MRMQSVLVRPYVLECLNKFEIQHEEEGNARRGPYACLCDFKKQDQDEVDVGQCPIIFVKYFWATNLQNPSLYVALVFSSDRLVSAEIQEGCLLRLTSPKNWCRIPRFHCNVNDFRNTNTQM